MSAHTGTRHLVPLPPVTVALLLLLATMVGTGGVCVWAMAAPPELMRTLIYLGCALASAGLSVTVAVATYALQAARRFRAYARDFAADAERLADETLPAVVRRLRDGAPVDTALAEAREPVVAPHRRLLGTLVDEVVTGERMRAAAMATCANAAGRVQAMATSMLADLREMQQRHDSDVLGDLMHLDHSTAQMGRLADNIAVLSGARSGRRWTKPIVMESVLRGAVGRISAYQRVRWQSASSVAIAGYAAEGVMHALAELMDNATSFSPYSEEVDVYVEEVQAGVAVTIEDGGLVMSDCALHSARRAVSEEPLDLTMLSSSRLGLAVVGCLARKYGLTVSFRPSSRGGTGVVMLVPHALLTEPQLQLPRGSEPAPDESTVDDLLKRRGDQELARVPAARPHPGAGTRFAAFRASVHDGRDRARKPNDDGR
jgi:hypothetical protein